MAIVTTIVAIRAYSVPSPKMPVPENAVRPPDYPSRLSVPPKSPYSRCKAPCPFAGPPRRLDGSRAHRSREPSNDKPLRNRILLLTTDLGQVIYRRVTPGTNSPPTPSFVPCTVVIRPSERAIVMLLYLVDVRSGNFAV